MKLFLFKMLSNISTLTLFCLFHSNFVFDRYLRDTLTDFLVRLLECQPERMWTFDGFFEAADDLLQKHRLHLFSVVDCQLHLIYMDPAQKYKPSFITDTTEIEFFMYIFCISNFLKSGEYRSAAIILPV